MAESTGTIGAQAGQKPSGLGGWLLLVLFSLAAGPIGGLLLAAQALPYREAMGALASNQIFFVVAGLGITLIISVIVPLHLLVLILGRRRTFPRWWIALTWASVLIAVVKVLVGYFVFSSLLLGDDVPLIFRTYPVGLVGAIVGAFAWTAYMLNSVRVRNTFVK